MTVTLWDGMVDATGTRRRAHGMCYMGWSLAEQSRRLGWCSARHYPRIIAADSVNAGVAHAVAGVYAELADRPAPITRASAQTRQLAVRNRWAPPAAWDDDTIDNPHARPQHRLPDTGRVDDIAVSLVCSGGYQMPLRGADRDEAIRRLVVASVPAREIADRLCCDVRTVGRVMRRYHLSYQRIDTGPSWEWIAYGRTYPKNRTAAS